MNAQEFKIRRNSIKHRSGPRMIVTEAQTLDQALDIIAHQQKLKQRTVTRLNKGRSLRREISIAKLVASNRSVTLSTGVVKSKSCQKIESLRRSRLPHPFRDLSEDQKPARAREMYASRNFGFGAIGGRRIAALFDVSIEVITEWLGIEIWIMK